MRPSRLAFGLLALPLLAQQAPPPSEAALPEVKVKAKREAAPAEGYVATRAASATRMDLPLAETPQAIAVIPAEQLRDQNAQSLQEALRYTAGVVADEYGLDNRGDWFLLRGGSRGSTLLDGLRRPLTGWYGIVRDEPFAFERIDVLRGPASVAAGQNGPGGLVNLVSKRPLAQAQSEFEVQYGGYGHRQTAADLTGPVDGDGVFLYRVVALDRTTGTQVDHADQERQLFAPSFTWRPGPEGSLTVFAEYQHDRSKGTEGFYPLEGTYRPGPNGFIPTSTFVGEPDWDTYGGIRTRAGFQAERRLGAWTLRADFRHDEVEGNLRGMYANYWEGFLADGRSLNRTWYASENRSHITNASLSAQTAFAWGASAHRLVAGADGLWLDDRQTSLSGAATPLDVYAPVYGTFPHPDLAFGAGDTTRTRATGLFLQDQVKLGPLSVLAGLRHDRVRTTVNGSGAAGQDDQAFTRNLGLVVAAGAGWHPYLSYAESFEPVSGADAQGRGFRPLRGRQLEAGVKWMPEAAPVTATASVYRLRERNRLTADPADPNNQLQKGEVTADGAELQANARVRGWDLVAAYTYTLAKTTESGDPADPALGKHVANVPEQSGSLWAVKALGGGFRAGLGVRYVGVTWDGADALKTPSHTVWDALAAYERGPWRLAVNASNLFDKVYLAALLDRGDAWYGSRRKVVASLGYRW